MATVSSLGIGTGVDLQNMLSTIMAAERQPLKVIENKITSTNTKISLYGTLNSKLDALQTAADTWRFPSRMSAITATASDSSVLDAKASFSAGVGSYAVEVTQLASAQKSFSNSYASGTTFGAGQLTFTVGSTTGLTVNISDGATLTDVSASINNAKIGVTATVVTSGDGSQRLIMTGDKTGTGNGFAITASTATPSSGSGLETFDTTTVGLQRSTAQDATLKIDGIEVTSSSNTFSSAISGLTLTASKLGTSNISVQNDEDKITTAVKTLVDAFNSVASTIKDNSGYDTATKTAKALSGDGSIRSVSSLLNNARTSIPSELASADLKRLSDIGITVLQSGQLSLDTTKLEQAIEKSPSGVSNLLKAYGEKFNSTIDSMQAESGVVANRVKSLKDSVSRFTDNKETLEARLVLIEKRYRAQFTALDKYVSSMQTTSGYLTQQLAQLSSS